MDTDLFYPERSADTYPSVAASAKEYCHGKESGQVCPVLMECLFYGLVTRDRFGIWGGMTPRERSALRRIKVLDKNKYVAMFPDSPYRELIENYLEQNYGGQAKEDEGGQPEAEDLPGLPEA